MLLCYDDNPDFGGHQVMALYGLEGILKTGAQVTFYSNPENGKLLKRLEELQRNFSSLKVRATPVRTGKFQGLRNRIFRKGIQTLTTCFREEAPARLLCIQGDIEDSCQAVLAGKKAGIETWSYIPVPHTLEAMGAKLGSLRDRFHAYLFQAMDRFITISPAMADLLRSRGTRCPIEVVYNGIDLSRFQKRDSREVRASLGLPVEGLILGNIGRIEFKQKQQLFLLNAFLELPDCFQGCQLVFAGSGPDQGELDQAITASGLGDRVRRLSWMEQPEQLYSALDMLMIPSRFEGVPLVMLEALASGIPVIGSDRDGMRDILPEPWRFEQENAPALGRAFKRCLKTREEFLEPLQKRIRTEMSLEHFQQEFARVALKELNG